MRVLYSGYSVGNPIEYIEGTGWVLSSTKEKHTNELVMKLKCPLCNETPTEDGHDPCIPNLKNVAFACCGHGLDDEMVWTGEQAYIKYNDGEVIRFKTTKLLHEYVEKNFQ